MTRTRTPLLTVPTILLGRDWWRYVALSLYISDRLLAQWEKEYIHLAICPLSGLGSTAVVKSGEAPP